MDIQKEISKLRKEIAEHNKAYYDLDSPTVSDYDYDVLMKRLIELEEQYPEYITPDSPTLHIGGKAQPQFAPVHHIVPLESLNDVFSIDELRSFIAKTNDALGSSTQYVIEPKIDGLSVSIEYIDGKLFRGATRGDGITGEDVTENLLTIRNLPKELMNAPHRLIVRGEVYMSRDTFTKLNEEREISGEKLFANPRNAAAGSLRQLDSKITEKRRLDIIVFNVQLAEGIDFSTHTETIDSLKNMGFPTVPYKICYSAEECGAHVDWLGANRDMFPFEIDGAVIKINKLSERTSLGSTSKAPRWAVAYKYPPEKKETVVQDIIVQVGRTGALTPKAIVLPVRLAGTTVTNATLHNQDNIDRLDIRIGDTVLIQKAGEIIPEIIEVILAKRPQQTTPYKIPDVCPECGSSVVRDEDGAVIRCTGAECPAQLLRNIAHFASRGAMDIEGLGISVTEALINNKLISSPADLYYLDAQSVASIDRFGKKSAENLLSAIEKSKDNGLARLLYAFGIRQVGQKAAKVLASHYSNLDELSKATADELKEIPDIGPVTAKYISDWLSSPQSKHQIKLLREAGVNFDSKEVKLDSRFAGKTFVLTGALHSFSRDEAEKIIESFGGKTSGSVSKKTSFVISGNEAGSKLTKAQSLNIPILTEDEFKEMIK